MARIERFHDDAITEGDISVSVIGHNLQSGSAADSDGAAESREASVLCDGNQFTAHLLHVLGANAYELWFGPQTQIQIGDKTVHVNAETDFLVDCIQRFCQPELNNAVAQYFGGDYAVRLGVRKQVVRESDSLIKRTDAAETKLKLHSDRTVFEKSESKSPVESARSNLAAAVTGQYAHNSNVASSRGEPTLAHEPKKPELPFVTGRSNRLAATAVDMVVDRPGELGLLFVYGPNGVGKTHLCKSVRERLRTRHGMRRVIYMRAEQFAIDFSESTRGAGFTAFRKKYRDVEGLIIDDAQFLLGKQGTLSELRNTVDDLLGRRRQLVFAADRPLSELVAMGSDLHARLSGGVSCSLEPLDKDLRRSVLSAICDRHKVELLPQTLDELAERSSGDGRLLYGLVFRLLTQQRIVGGTLSHDQAMNCLNDLFQASQPVLRLADIERVVCNSFGFEPKVLRDKSRSKNVTAARMLAMFLARRLTPSAYSEIGQYFGNRQHSTVISAQKRVENWLSSDEKLNHRGGAISIREWVRNAETSLRLG